MSKPKDRDNGSPDLLPPPKSRVSIFEVAVLEVQPSSDESFGQGRTTPTLSTAANNPPIFRAVCFVDIPEVGTECSLSPDGKRLAVSLSGGRVGTWVLPSFIPLSELNLHPKHAMNSAGEDEDEDEDEEEGQLDNYTQTPENKNETKGRDTDTLISANRTVTVKAGGGVVPTDSARLQGALLDMSTVVSPIQLGRPECCIPRIPSPEEKLRAKELEEYRRRLAAGEVPEPTDSGKGGDGKQQPNSTLPPPLPLRLVPAFHVAHVELLSTIEGDSSRVGAGGCGGGGGGCGGGGGGGGGDGGGGGGGGCPGIVARGGLSVWRSSSNVWRLYRLPTYAFEPVGLGTVPASVGDGGGGGGGGGDSGGGGGDSDECLTARLDVLALPSAEWVLPSPITACAVCRGGSDGRDIVGAGGGGGRGGASEGGEEGRGKGAREEGGKGGGRGGRGGGGRGEGLRHWASAASTVLPPLVAIGTENGGVYLSDAVLGTTREGLSRHRARVTALAFQGRRWAVESIPSFFGFHPAFFYFFLLSFTGGRHRNLMLLHNNRAAKKKNIYIYIYIYIYIVNLLRSGYGGVLGRISRADRHRMDLLGKTCNRTDFLSVTVI